jgi:hypothetical protein
VIRGFLLATLALFWLLVIRLLLRTLAALFGGGGDRQETTRPGPGALPVEDLVLDRVCHTHIPRSSALVARVAGHDEHFCSAACRDKALAGVARAS